MPKGKGFTLIELLIVITIIGILSTIGVVSYTSFIKNARDAKRQSDLKFIQSALEQYHADQHYYPAAEAPAENCQGHKDGLLMLGCPLKSPDGSKVYLSEVPTDPLNRIDGRNYCYEVIDYIVNPPGSKSYNLLTVLESKPPGSMTCYRQGALNFKVTRP